MKVGLVDSKSASVQFHVENVGEHGAGGQKFKFTSKENFINVGNGFDWDNQWFSVPYTGTYVFTLTGTKKRFDGRKASVFVRLNGKNIGEALSTHKTEYGGFSFNFLRKLVKGDKIELFLHGQSAPIYLLYFTGWMLEQELYLRYLSS